MVEVNWAINKFHDLKVFAKIQIIICKNNKTYRNANYKYIFLTLIIYEYYCWICFLSVFLLFCRELGNYLYLCGVKFNF